MRKRSVREGLPESLRLVRFEERKPLENLTFLWNGALVVAGKGYYKVYSGKNKPLSKVKINVALSGVSRCCDKFAAMGADGYAYIARDDGTLLMGVRADVIYDNTITLLRDGFIACHTGCAYFDFEGKEKWKFRNTSVFGRAVAVHNGYVYVPDSVLNVVHVLRLSDGTEVGQIQERDFTRDTLVCGNYLLVATEYSYLALYDITNPVEPRELWKVESDVYSTAWRAAFSPDCKYIVAAGKRNDLSGPLDYRDGLVVFSIDGEVLFETVLYEEEIPALDWWRDRLALALDKRTVEVYEFSAEKLKEFS